MIQIGKTSKKFSELVKGDMVYYIDPADLTIKELAVKDVQPFEMSPKHVVVNYFVSTGLVALLTSEAALEAIPTLKLIVPKDATSIITQSMPPTVYHTNKSELTKWSGLK